VKKKSIDYSSPGGEPGGDKKVFDRKGKGDKGRDLRG